MRIIIDTPTLEEPEKVFNHFKAFCIENLQEFELKINELNFKQTKNE